MALNSNRRAEHLRRLAALVSQRRAALDWSIEKTADEAGIAYVTYQRVERAHGVQNATYAKIERALGFVPGACQAVLDGAESISLATGGEIVEGGRITPINREDMTQEVRRAVTDATMATTPNLTAREISALNDQVVKALQDRGILPKGD